MSTIELILFKGEEFVTCESCGVMTCTANGLVSSGTGLIDSREFPPHSRLTSFLYEDMGNFLSATKTRRAAGESVPTQARGRGCSRDC